MKKESNTDSNEARAEDAAPERERRKIPRRLLIERKARSSKGPRLSFFLMTTVLILVFLVLTGYVFIFNRVSERRSSTLLHERASAQSDRLAKALSEAEDISDDLKFSLETVADFFDGRVLVVDQDYRIVCDTDDKNEGAYLISEDFMGIMTGTRDVETITKEGYFLEVRRLENEDGVRGILVLKASMANLSKLSGGFFVINLVIVFILLLISALVAFCISSVALRGLKKVGRAMNTAREGHLEDKLQVRGFREYRQLTENYNETIEQLMALDTTRQEFVSNVSHELKTPITSMKVLADSLIANEEADLDMYKEFMKDVALEIDRESQIITDLLTLVKTDKQSAEMNISEVNINDLLEVILKRVRPIAKERDIEITYESYREVAADVDEVKLSLALTNIVENAVKYNVDGGSVKVSLNADHKNFHIKVADTGVGIPDDCKEKVFERFYRVDKARSRDTGGTGLGLAITRNVIAMHHGSIKLYSESGQGTTFTIRIPIKYSETEIE